MPIIVTSQKIGHSFLIFYIDRKAVHSSRNIDLAQRLLLAYDRYRYTRHFHMQALNMAHIIQRLFHITHRDQHL